MWHLLSNMAVNYYDKERKYIRLNGVHTKQICSNSTSLQVFGLSTKALQLLPWSFTV